MQNLKFGVVLCGVIGLVGCFLPLSHGVSFFGTRAFDAANVYIIMIGFAAALGMGALGVVQGMQRWMAIIAIVGFSMIVMRMRGDIIELFKLGVGAKLIAAGALAGLVLAILTTVKPEPAKGSA